MKRYTYEELSYYIENNRITEEDLVDNYRFSSRLTDEQLDKWFKDYKQLSKTLVSKLVTYNIEYYCTGASKFKILKNNGDISFHELFKVQNIIQSKNMWRASSLKTKQLFYTFIISTKKALDEFNAAKFELIDS